LERLLLGSARDGRDPGAELGRRARETQRRCKPLGADYDALASLDEAAQEATVYRAGDATGW
jgi:hypothetical protein